MTLTHLDLDRIEGLAGRLRLCADDPMWADHAEVSKRLLSEAASDLTAMITRIREVEGALEPFVKMADGEPDTMRELVLFWAARDEELERA